MRHTFEEEFRLENPQWDFDNDILGPYTRWLDAKLLEARKQLALYNVVVRSEQLSVLADWLRDNYSIDIPDRVIDEYNRYNC